MNHITISNLEALARGLNAMPPGPRAQQLSLLQLIVVEVKSYLITFPNVFGKDPTESLHLIAVHMDTGAEVPVALQSGSNYNKVAQPVLHVYYGIGVKRMQAFSKLNDNTGHGHIILLAPNRPQLAYWRTQPVRGYQGHYENFIVYNE